MAKFHTTVTRFISLSILLLWTAALPAAEAEGKPYAFDDAWNEENEKKGIVKLNPDDP